MLITKSCCCFSVFSGISPPARFKKSPVLALLFLKRHAAVLCCLYTCFYVSSFVCFAGWTMPREKGTPFIMTIRRKSQEVVHFYSSSIVLEVVLKFIIFLANKNSLQSASQRSPRNARLRSEKVWFLFYFPRKEGRTSGRTITWCPPRVPSLSCKYDKLRWLSARTGRIQSSLPAATDSAQILGQNEILSWVEPVNCKQNPKRNLLSRRVFLAKGT